MPLAEQDRGRWDTGLIAEGVDILQAALAYDRLGEFQAQAAVAALHADAPTAAATDWVQILEWYDELVRLSDNPIVRLNRVVALGEADGPRAGLAALASLDPALPRYTAVSAYLHERDGDLDAAARLYAEAARTASNPAERDHLTRQAADFEAARRGATPVQHFTVATPPVLTEIAAVLASGRVEMPIAATYPFADVRAAYLELERGHTRGKIVLIP